MFKMLKLGVLSAALILVAGVIGFAPRASRAQGFDSSSGLSIQRFEMQGNGCPTRNSTRAFLSADRRGVPMLVVQFANNNGNGLSAFQVNGGGTESCTVRFLLGTSGFNGGFNNGGFNNFSFNNLGFALNLIEAGVTFVNRSGGGEILLRTQSSVNGNTSQVQTFRLPNTGNRRTMDVNIRPNLFASTGGNGTLDVRAIVQLQINGNPDAAIRLDDLELEFTTTNNNGGFGGPLGGGFDGGFGGGLDGGFGGLGL